MRVNTPLICRVASACWLSVVIAFGALSADAKGFALYSNGRLIGYSPDGTIDLENLPPQFSRLANESRLTVQPASAIAASRAAGGEKVLSTATWAQDGAFNKLAPAGCPAGCVATAMGIVMKYHNWPPTGTGSHSYNDKGTQHSFDYRTDFDFQAMQPDFIGHSTASADAISKLLYACGVAVDMDYDYGISSAHMTYAARALSMYFRYSPDYDIKFSSEYSASELIDAAIKDIDANRPVLVAGYDPYSGSNHAFVIDGYDSRSFLHVNWGWGGNTNGFFDISAFEPNHFITGISPLKSELETESVWPEGRVSFSPEYYKTYGLTTDCADIRQGQPFHFAVGDIYNGTGGDLGPMTYYIAHCDANGQIKEVLHTEYMGPLFDGRYENITISRELTCSNPVEGTDMLCLFYTDDSHPEKTRVYGYGTYPSGCSMTNHHVKTIPVEYELDKGVSVAPYFSDLPDIYEAVAGMPLFYSINASDDVSAVTIWHGDLAVETLTGNNIHGGSGYNAAWWIIAGNNCEKTIKVHLTSDLGPVVRDAVVHVDGPGWLGSIIYEGYDINELTSLKVIGTINTYDISYVSSWCKNLQVIDLSETELVEVEYSDTPAALPDRSFCFRPLRKIQLPPALIGIGADALRATELAEIDLPHTIRSIGENALGNNPKLRKVIARMSEPVAVSGDTFEDAGEATLVVNVGCRAKYAAAEGWKNFGNIVEEQLMSSVDAITVAADNNLREIYDLTGRKISASDMRHGGVYIVRDGAGTRKMTF